ncbi:MAG TPA: asparagine synthase (glutamine-hydrolyzing) [Candidatus Binatia bacterium]|nr:asparagine synthase (glutamine-hydrolyzing) [Candidatus Binatia bacterium]
MCGIAGVLRRQGEGDDRDVVAAMLGCLARRGPDGEGLVADGPLTLGHRRLAVLDLSDAGAQPMRHPNGRLLLSFNGEVYNFEELRRDLGLRPEDLRSHTDTEIILHAWERWGPAALDRMVGQWAIAVWDRAERRLWLARDRFGEKPLFYHDSRQALVFASSLAAVLKPPWVARELDRSALVEYLTLRYVVAPRTVAAGCRKVRPGHLVVADDSGAEERRWYEPRFRALRRADSSRARAEITEEFGSLLVQASTRCLVSDVPVGLLLSDGIDSNGIRSALAAAGRDVPTFTYTMTDEGGGLAPSASQNGAPRAPAWDVLVTPAHRIDAMVPAFASFTEPVGDGASLATWLVIRGAREKAEVFLCGHGGDEVLGGYRLSQDRFRLAAMSRAAWLPTWSLKLLVDNKMFGAETPAERQKALRRASRAAAPAAARYLIHRPLPVEDVRALTGDRDLAEPYLTTIDRLYGDCASDATDVDRIQEVLLRTFLTENILSFADSAAMDSSAELRLPYLDRDLVDFVLSLHPSARVSPWPGRANTKLVLRWWARGKVPHEVVDRRKHGFNYGSLRELLDGDGRTLRARLLDCSAVRSALPGIEPWLSQPTEFFRGPREKTLWSLLALAAWSEPAGVGS